MSALAWFRLLPQFLTSSRIPRSRLPVQVAGPDPAFVESYLDALRGRHDTRHTDCRACHPDAELAQHKSSFLNGRGALGREAWADAIPLPAKCGVCHLVPDPSNLPRQSWSEVIDRMVQIMGLRGATKPTADERLDILHFYLTFSPETQPSLAADPDPRESPSDSKASCWAIRPAPTRGITRSWDMFNLPTLTRTGDSTCWCATATSPRSRGFTTKLESGGNRSSPRSRIRRIRRYWQGVPTAVWI